jgi:hypothetical protein
LPGSRVARWIMIVIAVIVVLGLALSTMRTGI